VEEPVKIKAGGPILKQKISTEKRHQSKDQSSFPKGEFDVMLWKGKDFI
jgi:hypothetical protein